MMSQKLCEMFCFRSTEIFGNFLPMKIISLSDLSVLPAQFPPSAQEVCTLFSAVGKGFCSREHGLHSSFGQSTAVIPSWLFTLQHWFLCCPVSPCPQSPFGEQSCVGIQGAGWYLHRPSMISLLTAGTTRGTEHRLLRVNFFCFL